MENLTEKKNLPTTNTFTFKRKLKEMTLLNLGEITITMNEILGYLKSHSLKPFTLKFEDQNKNTFILKCYNISENEFDFELGEIKGENIFTAPIIYYENNDNFWEFISLEQIHFFLNSFYSPMIQCKIENIHFPPTLFNIVNHIKHDDTIVDIFKYEIYDKNSFDTFFKDSPKKFLNETFETPKLFDKNFDFYFNYNKNIRITGNFHIYDDELKSRYYICKDLLDLHKPSPYYYYGSSGKGKSITILGALKYRKNYYQLGSFYINCKSIKNQLLAKNYLWAKQIIINEILFLNPHSYSLYEKSTDYIKSFIFKDEFGYLELIDKLLENFRDENFHYLIAFDNYSNLHDQNKYLKKILKKYEEKENLKFIICSSTNDTDIKAIKKSYLFQQDCPNKNNYCEIKKICRLIKDDNLNFEQKLTLDKFGNSFKVYNEIKIVSNIEQYIKDKKFQLSKKIISFYLKDDEINKYIDETKKIIKTIPFTIIGQILCFQTDYIYNRENIMSIIDYIPPKFYEIKKEINNNYIVKFSFPFIQEIIYDIYSIITLNNNYNILKKILNNKGSGLGTIFELKILFNLFEGKKIFNFTINKKYEIRTIIPKSNESINTKLKITLKDNSTYVIQQQIFNGKALDCLIIRVINEQLYIYGFQISTYKEEIFNADYIIKAYKDMIENLELIFSTTIDYNKCYFSYIFDYSRVTDKDYEIMLDNCNTKHWKYCFFDTNDNIFCDKNHLVIENIDSIVTCPLLNEKKFIPQVKQKFTKYELLQLKIKELISKEKKIAIKELSYLGKEKGPIFNNYSINILEKEAGVKIIFLNNEHCIKKFIENSTLVIYDSYYEEGLFDIYRIL